MTSGSKYCLLLCSLALFASGMLSAQVIKPPVAEDDYAETFLKNPVSVNVLVNDHSYEGDTLVIYAITDVSGGQAFFEDSLIHFTPMDNGSLAQNGKVWYMIKDLTTGLWSETALLTIALKRVKHKVFSPNGLRVRINAVGNHFMALDTFAFDTPSHLFEAPPFNGASTVYNSALWIAGLDQEGNIHSACERFRKGKSPYVSRADWDFWVGPVLDTIHYTPEYLVDFNRLWYLTREEVREHVLNFQEPGYVVPDRIRKWPGNGYPELGSAEILAPFADKNQNGLYDPEFGDYPVILGDEAIYFIFNDAYGEHQETRGRKLGVEVHGMAYGFNCPGDSAFHNTLFVRYQAINRSDTAYHDVYIGSYNYFAIGAPDDYLGCDTLLNACYAYNPDDSDSSASVYFPSFGAHPPAQAVVMLDKPIDHFIYFQMRYPFQDTLFNFAPWLPGHYYNYMRSLWKDGTHLTYGGDGHLGAIAVNHALTGNPVTGSGWLEPHTGLEDVLYGVASSGPWDFLPGDTLTLELAYVFARDYEGDHLASVTLLKERIERIRWFYDNDSTPCATPWTGIAKYRTAPGRLLIIPNPAGESIRLFLPDGSNRMDYEIYRGTGERVRKGMAGDRQKIDISGLSPGCYMIRLYNQKEVLTSKFIKID